MSPRWNIRSSMALTGVLLGCDPLGGREVTIGFRVESDGVATFRSRAGWEVTLDEARMSLGPVYLHQNPPVVASLLPLLWDAAVPTSLAHPGDQHFNGGPVLVEWLDPQVVDALHGGERTSGLTATAGRVQSSVIHLASLPAPSDALRGHHAWVRGRARRTDQPDVVFEGGLDLPPLASQRRIDGLPVDATLDQGGCMVVVLRPHVWLQDAAFDQIAPSPQGTDGSRIITADSQVHAAWFLGIRSSDAYSLRWEATCPTDSE